VYTVRVAGIALLAEGWTGGGLSSWREEKRAKRGNPARKRGLTGAIPYGSHLSDSFDLKVASQMKSRLLTLQRRITGFERFRPVLSLFLSFLGWFCMPFCPVYPLGMGGLPPV